MKDEIKSVVNSILLPHPKGLTVEKLIENYARVECRPLPFRAMGYKSPQHMLSEMSDAIRYIQLPSGHSVVQAIPDEQTSHISEMVAKQKNTKNSVMQNITSLLCGSGHRPPTNRPYYQNSHHNSTSTSYSRPSSSFTPKPTVTVNYSTYIILNLKELLRFYPSGVELRLVYGLFQKKFNHCIDLKKLDSDKPSEFFEKYPNVFQVWQNSGAVMVCLKQHGVQSSSVKPNQHSEQRTLQVENISAGVSKSEGKDVYTPDIVLKYQDMPSDLGELEYFLLVVAHVYSPGHFYWFLRQNLAAIETLTDDMNVFYNVNSHYEISPEEIYIGQVVAAQYSDRMWYRGRVVACREGQLKIFFLDYGSTLNVDMEKVRHLHVQFTKLPIQGLRGRLFGICPVSNEQSKWSVESSKYFLSLVMGSKMTGSKVIAAATMKQEFDESEMLPVFALTLIDTNSEKDIDIADCLVEKGLAQIDCSDAVEIQVPTNLILQSRSPSPTIPLPPQSAIGTITVQDQEISGSMNTAPLKRQVKALEMADGHKVHIIRVDEEMFLSGIEMALLIPNCQTEENLDRTKAQMNLAVECTVIHAQTTPNVFNECDTLDVPWIKDNEGNMIDRMTLYPLKVVSPLLFIFGAKNKEVTRAIGEQMKDVDDPHWR